jgi:hypothetical protein
MIDADPVPAPGHQFRIDHPEWWTWRPEARSQGRPMVPEARSQGRPMVAACVIVIDIGGTRSTPSGSFR